MNLGLTNIVSSALFDQFSYRSANVGLPHAVHFTQLLAAYMDSLGLVVVAREAGVVMPVVRDLASHRLASEMCVADERKHRVDPTLG